MAWSRYYKTEKELAEASRRQSERAAKEYREAVESMGKEEADRMAGDIYDGHSCSEFATNGGYCAFCGAVIPGSPADRELNDYDPPDDPLPPEPPYPSIYWEA